MGGGRKLPPCRNSLSTSLLTDTYQITMAYAYWKNGTHVRSAAFDLFFRKNPFGGEFTVFAGLEECLRFISNFKFTDADIEYLRKCVVHKPHPRTPDLWCNPLPHITRAPALDPIRHGIVIHSVHGARLGRKRCRPPFPRNAPTYTGDESTSEPMSEPMNK